MIRGLFAGSLLLASALTIPQATAAQKPCSEVKVDDLDKDEEGNYEFYAYVECTFPKSGVSSEAVRQGIHSLLESNGTIANEGPGKIEDSQQPDLEKMVGTKFEYTDPEHDAGHGTIAITYASHLVAGPARVFFRGNMKSKEAHGQAKNIQSVRFQVDLGLNGSQMKLTLSKKITVSKPFAAPKGMFKKAVIADMTTELNHRLLPDYKQMIESL